jgi:hypothetical protein
MHVEAILPMRHPSDMVICYNMSSSHRLHDFLDHRLHDFPDHRRETNQQHNLAATLYEQRCRYMHVEAILLMRYPLGIVFNRDVVFDWLVINSHSASFVKVRVRCIKPYY